MVLGPCFENHYSEWDLPCGSDGKASAYNAGDLSLIPGSEDPLETEMATHSSAFGLEDPMDGGAW